MIFLNDIQYRFWMDDYLRADNAYNVAYSFRIVGDLSLAHLRDALHHVMKEYAPFHAVIRQNDEHPYFFPDDSFQVPLEVECITDEMVDEKIDAYAGKRILLAEEYPCRFYLLVTPTCHYLLLLFHHIVMDGLTMEEFCGRLSCYYTAYSQGDSIKGHNVDTVRALESFNHYWEENEKASHEADVAYWVDYLKEIPLRLPVPMENIPSASGKATRLHDFELGEACWHQSLVAAKQMNATPFQFFSAVWAVALQYCLQEDTIVIDHTIHLRPKAFKGLLGSYVNNLPIRVSFSEMQTFVELLAFMKANRHQERLHQNVTYTDIVSRMRQQQCMTESSDLFNVSIDYPIRNHSFTLDFPNCHTVFYRQNLANMIGDICLAIEEKETFPCGIRYREGVDESFVKLLAGVFSQVMQQVIYQPTIALAELHYLSKEQQQAILDECEHALYQPLPINLTGDIIASFQQKVIAYPNKTALCYHDKSITYKELDEYSRRVACWLLDQVGSAKTIGLFMHRGWEMIVAIWGILRSGNDYVPFDRTTPLPRLFHMVADSGVTVIFAQSDALPALSFPSVQVMTLEAIGAVVDRPLPPVDLSQKAYIIYTSGTTGEPKGIPITHANLLNLVRNDIANFQLTPESVVLQSSNICFDASVAEIFPALTIGATLVVADEEETKDPSLLAALLEQQQVTCATIPPALLPLLPKREYPHLQTIILGGESTAADVVDYWKQKKRLLNAYGPTENTVDTTFCQMQAETPANDIGTPLSGVACYVLDKQMNLLPDNVPGELYIGGNQLTNGYLNLPKKNKELFVPNPFQTEEEKRAGLHALLYKSGDLVKRLPNRHLLFIGRVDFQVKIRGMRMELGDISNNLSQLDGVNRAFVNVIDVAGEKKLVAYVEPRSGVTLSVAALRQQLSDLLPSYMIPHYWSVVTSIPLTSNGKVDRKALLSAPLLLENEKEEICAPKTVAESMLCHIVASILGVEKVGTETDLFHLGMSSIQVMRAAFEAEKYGIEVSVSRFYASRTIAKILSDKQSRYCYAVNTIQKEKPLLLIVCGYPYLSPSYDAMVEVLKDHFSLLVLESYNEYFQQKEVCTLKELLDFYLASLSPLLHDVELAGMIGLCLGGEIALQLASLLEKQQLARPKVFVLDGFSDRLEHKTNSFIEEPGVSEAANRERNRISDALIDSFFFNPYDGEVHICLADQFTKHLSFENAPEESDPVVWQCAYERFLQNGPGWKRLLPDCRLHAIHATHWSMMRGQGLEQIKQLLLQTLCGTNQ